MGQGQTFKVTDRNPVNTQFMTKKETQNQREFVTKKREEIFNEQINTEERRRKSLDQKGYGDDNQQYAKGELVMYKESINGRWVGPGRMLRIEGNKVRIVHEGYDKLIPIFNVMSYAEENKETNCETIKR